MKFSLLFIVVLIAFAVMSPQESPGRSFSGARSASSIYSRHCASCHGKDGRAKTKISRIKYHARDLTDAGWQEKVTDERLFNSIINGKGKMPGYSKRLSEPEIDSLVTYVRALRR